MRHTSHSSNNLSPQNLYLGKLTWYLVIHFIQSETGIVLHQRQYILDKITQLNLPEWGCSTPLTVDFMTLLEDDNNERDASFPYRSAVGSLIHFMRCTRPDIAAAVSVVSRYLDNPTKVHCGIVKRIYQYLRTNPSHGLHYQYRKDDALNITGFCDSSYANSIEMKSMAGYAILLGNCLVSWNSHTQGVVALSSAEAEYMALTEVAKEVIWFKGFTSELKIAPATPVIYEDNQSAISLAKNPKDHKRTKHINVRFHFIRDLLKRNRFTIQYVPTVDQLADLFTKAISGPKMRALMTRLGILKVQN